MSRPRTWVPVLLALALVASGCASEGVSQSQATPSPEAVVVGSCDDLPRAIAQGVQTYVDGFADVEADAVPQASASGLQGFRATSAELRSRGDELGCDREALATALRDELAQLRGGSPVQDAVLATLVADPLGTFDPADPSPVEIEVSTSDDLVAALSLAGSGSTISVAPGTYEVSEPLVALRPVTLVGAGTGRTVLRSSAGGAALLIDADGDVAVRDLSVEHYGSAPASVVIVTGGGYDLDNLRLAGALAADSGAGGFGLVVRTSAGLLRADGSRAVVSKVVMENNDGGGAFVGGDAAPALTDVTVTASGGCGLCFVESSAGSVASSSVTQVPVGVRVDGGASPQLMGVKVLDADVGVAMTGSGAPTFADGTVERASTGFEITGSGSPGVADTLVTDCRDIGIRLAGTSTAQVRDVTVSGETTVGVGVADRASPAITTAGVSTVGEVNVVWAGRSSGSATGLRLGGSRLALQLSDDATPAISDVRVTSADEAALLASGASSGRVTALTCPTDAPVALVDETTVLIREPATCQVVDAR